nr:hypothetical protein CFP56_28043 [Quercus suber]
MTTSMGKAHSQDQDSKPWARTPWLRHVAKVKESPIGKQQRHVYAPKAMTSLYGEAAKAKAHSQDQGSTHNQGNPWDSPYRKQQWKRHIAKMKAVPHGKGRHDKGT